MSRLLLTPLLFILFLGLSPRIAFAKVPKPLALVYSGPGICAECDDDLIKAFRKAGFEARKISPGHFTDKNLAKAAVVAIPGGDEEGVVKNAFHAGEAERIKKYVESGGHYLGVCLGAYIAAPKLYTYDRAPARFKKKPGEEDPGLNLFDGKVKNHSGDKLARDEKVLWKGKPYEMYFQDGPEFILNPDAHAEIWAKYSDGAIAAFQSPLGNGRVGLLGPHLEADLSWYAVEHLKAPEYLNQERFSEFVHALIGDAQTKSEPTIQESCPHQDIQNTVDDIAPALRSI